MTIKLPSKEEINMAFITINEVLNNEFICSFIDLLIHIHFA